MPFDHVRAMRVPRVCHVCVMYLPCVCAMSVPGVCHECAMCV